MKLLLAMNLPYSRWSGGANRANRYLLEGLSAHGHLAVAIVPLLAAPTTETEDDVQKRLAEGNIVVDTSAAALMYTLNGVRVHAVRSRANLRAYLRDQVRALEPDVLLISSEDQSQQLLDAALREQPERTIYVAHTPQMLPFGPESLHPGESRTAMVRSCRAILAISRTVADYIQRYAGCEVFVAHPPMYGAGPYGRCGDFSARSVLLLNPCAVKGISIFVALAERFPEASFIAVPGYGTTSHDRELLAKVRNISLRSNMPSLDDLMSRTTALLMPTLWMEGFGLATVDAMLRGVPVLAAAHGGLLEAKLGTDGLLPITPITGYRDYLDEALLPEPVLPSQDLMPWHVALEKLLTKESYWREQSESALRASDGFVKACRFEPLEIWLAGLAAAPRRARTEPAAQPTRPVTIEERIKALSRERQAVLLHRLITARCGGRALVPSRVTVRDDGIPLSPPQESVWLAQQRFPSSCAYNMALVVRITGTFSPSAFDRALQDVMRRQSALRTTYRIVAGKPRQFVQATTTVSIETIDVSGCGSDAVSRGKSYLEQLSATPFRLDRDFPIRLALARVSCDDWILAVVLHHVCCDGWSIQILARELSAAYDIATGRQTDGRLPLPFEYIDYASWLNRRINNDDLLCQIDYWRRQLQGFVPLHLGPEPLERKAGPAPAGSIRTTIPDTLTSALRSAGAANRGGLFALLLAGVTALLHTWTDQRDIAVAVDVANRNNREWHDMIGLVANQVLVRTEIHRDMPVSEIIERSTAALHGALENQEAPWERVSQMLPVTNGLPGMPRYQVKLVYSAEAPALGLPGAVIEELSRPRSMTKCDLTFFIDDRKDSLHVEVEFNLDRIGSPLVQKYVDLFPYILQAVATRPAWPIGQVLQPAPARASSAGTLQP